MRIDPAAEALRLLEQVDTDDLADLAADPATAVELLFDVEVGLRPPSPPGIGCAVDGTYHPGSPARVLVANDVTPARQRFTILHELGHHFIEYDNHLNDLPVDDAARRDEEICNEVAANVLLPRELVERGLPAGVFTAGDVATLYRTVGASRMACCVAAARRLRRPGCVILGLPDGTATFTAHHPATPWRIARDTPQGEDSLLSKAATSPSARARGVTQARFARGNTSGNVHGDAFAADDGWVYEVIVADSHSPWVKGLNLGLTDTGPEPEDIECSHCGEASQVWTAPCPTCGDRACPRCGRCSCPVGPTPRPCPSCGLLKPPNQFPGGATVCVDCQ
ncbi:MAG: ImmA/IrrE family metallo-endopeptidase [Acidimicrobiales bacterium]